VIECAPGVRVDVEKAATPELTGTVASTAAPSRNCTVPGGAGFRFAVNVTVWPTVDGFRLEASVNATFVCIVCIKGAEVDPALLASPLYTAVME
jgi:hypothetical protein